MFDGRVFQDWHSTDPLLWIHGKRTFVGTWPLLIPNAPYLDSRFGEKHPLVRHFYTDLSLCGNLSLLTSSAIIQHILSAPDAFVAYFYFDFRDDNKKHRHNLLPSLLVQLAARSKTCCDIVSQVYSAHGKGTQKPSDKDLMNCLTNMLLASPQYPTYIIMDALDESPDCAGVRSPREHVLGFVQELVELRLPNLYICVTSRPEIDICNRLKPLTSLQVSLHDQAGHKADIIKYISSEVHFISEQRRWRESDKKLVFQRLSEKADGM